MKTTSNCDKQRKNKIQSDTNPQHLFSTRYCSARLFCHVVYVARGHLSYKTASGNLVINMRLCGDAHVKTTAVRNVFGGQTRQRPAPLAYTRIHTYTYIYINKYTYARAHDVRRRYTLRPCHASERGTRDDYDDRRLKIIISCTSTRRRSRANNKPALLIL